MSNTHSTTFPDGTRWAIQGSTITSEGPRGSFSWDFPSELEATLAWVQVCTH